MAFSCLRGQGDEFKNIYLYIIHRYIFDIEYTSKGVYVMDMTPKVLYKFVPVIIS